MISTSLTGWWTIPGTFTKNGEPHRVPLTADVLALIQAHAPDADTPDTERPEYVFVGRVGVAVLDRAKKAPAIIAKLLKFDFRGHDLRRTAATKMAEAGIPREHIARVLNHVEGGPRATKVYDRYSYDQEKKERARSVGSHADSDTGDCETCRYRRSARARLRWRRRPG